MSAETEVIVIPPASVEGSGTAFETEEAAAVRSGVGRGVRPALGFVLLGVGVAATAAFPAYGVYLVVRYLLKG